MKDLPESERAERLRVALDLFESGVNMKRESLRREFPDLSQEQLEARLVAWLQHRPGAEHGDCAGKPGRWPDKVS